MCRICVGCVGCVYTFPPTCHPQTHTFPISQTHKHISQACDEWFNRQRLLLFDTAVATNHHTLVIAHGENLLRQLRRQLQVKQQAAEGPSHGGEQGPANMASGVVRKVLLKKTTSNTTEYVYSMCMNGIDWGLTGKEGFDWGLTGKQGFECSCSHVHSLVHISCTMTALDS